MVSSDRRSGVPTVPKRAMFWARLKLDCAWPIANYMRLTNPNELLGLATHNQICGWGYPDLRSLTNWPYPANLLKLGKPYSQPFLVGTPSFDLLNDFSAIVLCLAQDILLEPRVFLSENSGWSSHP